MFHHQTALNGAILDGATQVFNRYGGHTMSDFLDINWYKDEDWVTTFQHLLERVKDGETTPIWGHSTKYEITLVNRQFLISTEKGVSTKIPTYSENDLFLYLSTLLRGNYEY